MNIPFFQVPTLEFVHGTGVQVQESLYSGTKVGTASLCADRFH